MNLEVFRWTYCMSATSFANEVYESANEVEELLNLLSLLTTDGTLLMLLQF